MNPATSTPSMGMTDQFGNKIINPNWQQPAQSSASAQVRKPGNLFTHLLPAVGGTLGAIIGTPADLISGIGGTVAGGAGGSALGKLLENKIEKQPLSSGVGGQALLGGAGGLGGEILGAGFDALKGGIQAGADAGTAAGDAAADVATQTGKTTATQAGGQNVGEKLMASVRGISPDALPGSTVGNVGEATRLNNVATDMGLRGSSTQQLGQLAKQFDQSGVDLGNALQGGSNTTSLSDINQAIDNAIKGHPLNPGIPELAGGDTAQGVALSGPEFQQVLSQASNPAAQQFTQAGETIKSLATKMAQDNDGNFSDGEINTLRQQVDKLVNFNKSPDASPDIMNESARATRGALNDILATNNPEARGIISNQSDMIKIGDLLGKQSGYARAGVRIGGVRVPLNVGSALESAQAGVGTLLGGGTNAERLIPALGQAGAQAVGNKVEQATQAPANNQAAGQLQGDTFATPSQYVQQLIQSSQAQSNSLGITPEQVQQAMVKDIQTTGGANLSHLNDILGVVTKAQSANALPTAAVTQLTAYNNSLQALQGLANAFGGSSNASDLTTNIADAQKILGTASGLSGKNLTAALPTPYDTAQVVQQKLSALKSQIDSTYENSIQAEIDKQNATSNQSGFLSGLIPAGASQ